MGLTLFFQGATAAASAGMGCGTCFGAGMGTILSGYLLTHAKSIRESFCALLCFFLGKIISTVALCIGASLVGAKILTETGTFSGVPVQGVVDALMILMGICFLLKWFHRRRNRVEKTCGHCANTQSCEKPDLRRGSIRLSALLIMGLGYGMTPCAPLLMIVGYAATLPIGYAAAAGCVFALSSAISPLLIFFLLSGALAVQIYK